MLFHLGGYHLKEGNSSYRLISDVKDAIHRNLVRLDSVYGMYNGRMIPVNTYTLVNGDNVITYLDRGAIEIRYLPKKNLLISYN